ncbi:hypothetical protein RIF29_37888 [Crotalaria pallida]|uniref:Uncharacterized protein n=1 Tax=Crotalaria pallida TaxID=3830 RepID=A0AAN9DY73_CROPI
MARKRGRPPKTPSSTNKSVTSKPTDHSGSHSKVDFSQLDEDDLEDIDNLSPKQAELWMNKIDILRAKIQEKGVPAGNKDSEPIIKDVTENPTNPNPTPATEEQKEIEVVVVALKTQEAIVNETIPPENIDSTKEEAAKVIEAATNQGHIQESDKGKQVATEADDEGWIPV